MDIEQAVKIVVEKIRKTQMLDRAAVESLWPKLSLDKESLECLAQEGLMVRVSDARKHSPSNREPNITNVSAVYEHREHAVINVSVQILYDKTYTVNGVNRAIINFTKQDCMAYIQESQERMEGIQSHITIMEYVRERLTKLNKKSVADLAIGEQTILARKFEEVRQGHKRACAAD